MLPEPFERHASRAPMAIVSAFMFLLVVGDVWMLARAGRKPDDLPYAIGGLLVFVPTFVAALIPLLRPRALLRLDADGVSERGYWGAERLRLPWSNLVRAESFRWHVVTLLALVPLDEGRAIAEGPEAMRKTARGSRRAYTRPFVVDPRMYGMKAADLLAEIERRLAVAPPVPVAYPRSFDGIPSPEARPPSTRS